MANGGVYDGAKAQELKALGLELAEDQWQQLAEHMALVAEWNDVLSLVSECDVGQLWERHVLDALALAPWVKAAADVEGLLLDIGSGGGFPAVPLKVAFPKLGVAMIERSTRKAGFLRKVVAALELRRVEIVAEPFRESAGRWKPDVITARAVEKVERVMRGVLGLVEQGSVWLCQSNVPDSALAGFHVEHVQAGPRGKLRVVRCP
jgi:16S rRNA (guanine527-N7)-methyltransferase